MVRLQAPPPPANLPKQQEHPIPEPIAVPDLDLGAESDYIPKDESPDTIDELDTFAREVLDKMSGESIPPIPNNYHLYFDRLLDEKSPEFKKHILQILDLEDSGDDEKLISQEKRLKQGFANMKLVMQCTASLYKNLKLMETLTAKRNREISKNMSPMALQNIVHSVHHDLDKLNHIVKKQAGSLREVYDKNAAIMLQVESETIFDEKFGLYNRRYLTDQLEKEIRMIEQFGHKSTLIMAKLSSSLTSRIKNKKTHLLMVRTMSKLILKTSRRTDIIAHYGNGTFAMLLKHSDMFSAKKASERLNEMVSSTNFFMGDKEIQLEISIGIANADISRDIQTSIEASLNAMEQNDASPNSPYHVCSGDEE